MTKEKFVPLATAVGVAASMVIALPVFAQTSVGVSVQGGIHNGANGGVQMQGEVHAGMRPGMAPGIFGSVTAVNGNTLTVTAMAMMRPYVTSTQSSAVSSTVYTVDASNATIYKGSATTTVSISSVDVGDKVLVQGTVSGDDVTATVIRDGFPIPMGVLPGGVWHTKGGAGHPTSTPSALPIQGNGEPVVGGAITAINGDTLTVTNTSNVTYTIDVTNATIVKNGTSTAVSGLAIGDTVVVQGTVNGTSVTASSVLDQGAKPANASSTSGAGAKGGFGGRFGGIFGVIGGFFQHLFGF